MPLPTIPYDAWFDDKVNPLDLMPIATDEPLDLAPSSVEPDDTIHEKMYRLATESGKHTIGGGSEQVQK